VTVHSLVRPIVGVSIAVWRGDRVLIVQRGRPPMMDVWSFPGGRLEPGERLADAALRELAEETSVGAEMAGLVDVVEIITHGEAGQLAHHVVLALFAAQWRAGEPVAGDDARAVAFVTLDELSHRQTTAGLLGYAEAARRRLAAMASPR
jgi:8-oxo-dGTP diphosphatase